VRGSFPAARRNSGSAKWIVTSLPELTAVETPKPSVRRYSAKVVVKLPLLEWMATDPGRSVSSGASPPRAPPIRT